MTFLSVAATALLVTFSHPPVDQQQAAKRELQTALMQGFNVVLVVGETQPGQATSTVSLPEGAARALKDMGEFLPYKHFRVLDAQWTSCCAPGRRTTIAGRLQGVLAVPAPNGAVNLVHRPFTFSIIASPSTSELPIRFVLGMEDSAHSVQHREAAAEAVNRELRRKNIQEDLETLEVRMRETQRRVEVGMASELEQREITDRYTQLKREFEALGGEREGIAGISGAPMIDSSFTMSLGETVVVGTSRLGGDKALIAIVTAVRKGAGRE